MQRTIIALVGFLGMLASPCILVAQDPSPSVSAPARVVDKDALQAKAEFHRTMAALFDERAAETPDQEKIKELQGKVEQLRASSRSPRGRGPNAVAGNGAGRGICPLGGPQGQGPNGRGMGRGNGPCQWQGQPGTTGGGRGMGQGPGAGRGRMQGGRGPGGRGQGRQ